MRKTPLEFASSWVGEPQPRLRWLDVVLEVALAKILMLLAVVTVVVLLSIDGCAR
jgi:hypothetical protein